MLLILGVLLFALPGSSITLPTPRELGRLCAITIVLLIATLAMERVGFIPAAVGLVAVVTLGMFERRPVWLLVTIAAVPLGTWMLFEWILKRPLP